VDGLRRLEYRGYDSVGIAVQTDKGIVVRKSQGKAVCFTEQLNKEPISSTCGIGYTRWTTHGRPSDVNAYPHRVGHVAVIHNGFVENHRTLKEKLSALGSVFNAETDTEVIAHLLNSFVGSGRTLEEAALLAVGELRGSYAFLAVSDKEPGVLVGAHQNCPMAVGLGDGEHFVASDIASFLSRTRDVLLLEDREMVIATPGSFRIVDFAGRPKTRKASRIDWTPEMAEKGGYNHFMLKEIHEQSRTIIDTLAGRMLTETGEVLFDTLSLTNEQISSIRRVVMVACGSSLHAALVGKFMIEGLARVPAEVDVASEYRYRDPVVEEGTLCLCISQSGETSDTLAGMREAKSKGATTVAICNVVGSTIAREADGVVYTYSGTEVSIASTKAFLAQLVVFYLLALHLGRTRDVLSSEEASLHLTELSNMPRKIEEYLKSDELIQAIAKKHKDSTDFFYLGRGTSYPIALEGALKLKETSYIHAEGYPAGEMRHGPVALIDEKMSVVVLCAKGENYEATLANMEEARARGGKMIIVGTEGDESLREKTEDVLLLPPCGRYARPIMEVVPLQLLAYYTAVMRGTNVDKPRNLTKSVSTEWGEGKTGG